MDKENILKKLEELYSMKDVREGFPSQQACIDWANKVAPLLKFNKQYYYNFIQNAHKMNLDLSSYTLGPAFKIMVSQVQMAIEELKLASDEEGNRTKRSSFTCGPLAKETCDLNETIKKEYSPKNIFIDMPYHNYDDCEEAIRNLIPQFGLIPIVAKDRFTSNAVLCKVCRLIKKCKYGISDISSGSNSVSYEYGLMHGLGMKVCLMLRSTKGKFTDIDGLEHLPYEGVRSFKVTAAKWILDNIPEADTGKIKEFIAAEERKIQASGEIALKEINPIVTPNIEIIMLETRHRFGCTIGGGRTGYHDINYALNFRVRNRSEVNVCLEDVKIDNYLLGNGKLDTTNSRLSRLPFNIGARETEELHLLVKFPNEINSVNKGKDIKLEARFEFIDNVITQELIGSIS